MRFYFYAITTHTLQDPLDQEGRPEPDHFNQPLLPALKR